MFYSIVLNFTFLRLNTETLQHKFQTIFTNHNAQWNKAKFCFYHDIKNRSSYVVQCENNNDSKLMHKQRHSVRHSTCKRWNYVQYSCLDVKLHYFMNISTFAHGAYVDKKLLWISDESWMCSAQYCEYVLCVLYNLIADSE